jgi:hypothetical protein|tara:strand:+ start:104 stop:304 length:201 start_codon:yes stop_codon:yes gene_type:complete
MASFELDARLANPTNGAVAEVVAIDETEEEEEEEEVSAAESCGARARGSSDGIMSSRRTTLFDAAV